MENPAEAQTVALAQRCVARSLRQVAAGIVADGRRPRNGGKWAIQTGVETLLRSISEYAMPPRVGSRPRSRRERHILRRYRSLAERLLGDLESVERRLGELLSEARVYDRAEPDDSPLVLITAWPYAWRPLPDDARALQLRLLEDWRSWDTEFRQLVTRLPPDVRRATDRARDVLVRFIEQDENEPEGVPPSVEDARVRVAEESRELRRALDALTIDVVDYFLSRLHMSILGQLLARGKGDSRPRRDSTAGTISTG